MVIEHGITTQQISVQQVYDVRRTIEIRTVALAALRRTDAEAAGIATSARLMRENFKSPDAVMEHDIAFHEAIAAASHNPVFALIVRFSGVTRRTWVIRWKRLVRRGQLKMIKGHGTSMRPQRRSARRRAWPSTSTKSKALLDAGIAW